MSVGWASFLLDKHFIVDERGERARWGCTGIRWTNGEMAEEVVHDTDAIYIRIPF